MINSIRLHSLRVSEFIQLQRDTLAIVLNGDPDALMVRAQYAALLSKTDEIEGDKDTPPVGHPLKVGNGVYHKES